MVLKALWDLKGVTPRQADDLLIWEIAVMLGASDELSPSEKGTRRSRRAGNSHDEVNRRLIRERIAHSKGLGPKPEAPPVSGAMLQAMAGSGMGGRGQ